MWSFKIQIQIWRWWSRTTRIYSCIKSKHSTIVKMNKSFNWLILKQFLNAMIMNTKLCTLRPWAVDDICVTILNMDEIFCIFFKLFFSYIWYKSIIDRCSWWSWWWLNMHKLYAGHQTPTHFFNFQAKKNGKKRKNFLFLINTSLLYHINFHQMKLEKQTD